MNKYLTEEEKENLTRIGEYLGKIVDRDDQNQALGFIKCLVVTKEERKVS